MDKNTGDADRRGMQRCASKGREEELRANVDDDNSSLTLLSLQMLTEGREIHSLCLWVLEDTQGFFFFFFLRWELLIVFKETPQGTFNGVDVNSLKLNLKVIFKPALFCLKIHVVSAPANKQKKERERAPAD